MLHRLPSKAAVAGAAPEPHLRPPVAAYPAEMIVERPVRINLLDATVCRDGQVLHLSGRDLELTYHIALRERPVARTTIIADVWPGAGERDALNSFNICLHRLRKRLGRQGAIVCTPHGYALGDPIVTDLRVLELFGKSLSGRTCLSEYEIELVTAAHRRLGLAAVPTQVADAETGEMLQRKIEYLKRDFAKRLSALFIQLAQTTKALDIAEEMIRLDGCDESAWEIVIRAHLAHNDRGAAIRDFRTYARNLAREVGLEPSHLIRELVAQ